MEEPEIQEVEDTRLYRRIFYGAIALVILIGFVYSSGIYQYFFYQRTSTSIQQKSLNNTIDAERLILPLQIFIIRNKETNGSFRTKEDIRYLIENASKIWNQAGIQLEIKEIQEISKTDREIDLLLDNVFLFQQNIEELNEKYIHVFLTNNLRGINGIAFSGLNSVAIADYTSVYDFRALAHEIGHILGLNHIPETQERLMYQGANGFNLTAEEISRARTNAETKF